MLDGMNKKFANPYVIFYPVLSRDGMAFPINKCLKEIQGPNYRENLAWRGNLVIAKYRDEDFSVLMDATMADFPLLKNYLSKHYSPMVSVSPFLLLSYTSPHRSPNVPLHYVVARFFWLREVTFLVLTRLPSRPRAPATVSCHYRYRSRLLRHKRHRCLVLPGVSQVGERSQVFWFNGEGIDSRGVAIGSLLSYFSR